MALPTGSVTTRGIAIGSSGLANDTHSMNFGTGSDTVYDGTLPIPIYPNKADAVRVTATGTLTSTAAGPTNATFKLILPIGTTLGSVQVTGVPANATVRFMCQFLMTFRSVNTDPLVLQATVESNGMIAVANAVFFPNWSPGPNSTLIPINVLGRVDVLVSPDANLAVSFDECVIEYLGAPS